MSRHILPRLDIGPDAAQSDEEQRKERQTQKRKRAQVAAACERCRGRKHRCDGLRPTCTPCKTKSLECQYRLPAGETHDSFRKRQVEQLHHNASELERVVRLIRESPDGVAQNLVQQLRTGDSMGAALSAIVGGLPASPTTSFSETFNVRQFGEHISAGSEGEATAEPISAANLSDTSTDRHSEGLLDHSQVDSHPDSVHGLYRAGMAGSRSIGAGAAASSPAPRDDWHWSLRSSTHISPRSSTAVRLPRHGEAAQGELVTTVPPASSSTSAHPLRLTQPQDASDDSTAPQVEMEIEKSRGPQLLGIVSQSSFESPGPHHQSSTPDMLPLSVDRDDCFLATMPVTFRRAALDMLSTGNASVASVVGEHSAEFGGTPVYVDLFFREKNTQDSEINVCNFACQLLKGLSADFDGFTLMAWAGAVAHYMSWAILPSPTKYRELPEMIRPIPSQHLVPHSPALDLCPNPGFREILLKNRRDWVTPSSKDHGACRVWPFTLEDAVEVDFTGKKRLTRQFEDWVANPRHWNFNGKIMESFPECQDYGITVRDTA